MAKINKHDSTLYTLINYQNNIVRLYHKDDDITIKCNEFCIYLDLLISENYNFYIIYNNPSHEKFFSQEDLNFIGMSIEDINLFDVEPIHSKTVQFFKEEKEKLLLFLENINNLYFYFFIPRLSIDNKFYYDLLLLFKDNYNVDNVSNYLSNIVVVDKILYLNSFDYNLNFFKLFFDFEGQIYKNNFLNKFQTEIFLKNLKDLEEWPEAIAYNNHKNDFSTESKKQDEILKKTYYDRLDNSYDNSYYKKMVYQTLCKNWWIINNDWIKYPVSHPDYNPDFIELDYERNEFIFFCDIYGSSNFTTVSFDKNGKAVCEFYLEWGSFHESLWTFPTDYNFFTGDVKKFK